MFTHLLLRLASVPLTPTPPNVNLTLTVQWVGMDGFPNLEEYFVKLLKVKQNQRQLDESALLDMILNIRKDEVALSLIPERQKSNIQPPKSFQTRKGFMCQGRM